MKAAEQRFEEALAAGDGKKMIMTILDLEYAIHEWSGDTEEDQGTSQARAVLRRLTARLGDNSALSGLSYAHRLEPRMMLRSPGKR